MNFMRSFLTVPGLFLFFFTGLPAGKVLAGTPPFTRNHTFFVFVIYIEDRASEVNVENTANWHCLGSVADNIPYCGPGQLQACQLIVDERDTELSKDGSRVLNPCVRISALLNQKAAVWFVDEYSPSGRYLYEILNEEDSID
jgi:hypothetical protein